MKQLLRNMYVDNKRILLRCDFNVNVFFLDVTLTYQLWVAILRMKAKSLKA